MVSLITRSLRSSWIGCMVVECVLEEERSDDGKRG